MYRCDALSQFPWLEHGFGTRLSNGWPDLNRLVTPKQIHSNRVLLVEPGAPTGLTARLGEGDALVCRSGDIIVGIRTADCVPILLADERTRAVGAIHAGWRGTGSEISSHTVDIMTRQFGTNPEDIWAAIGPSIGRCCFQVGPEVAAQFAADLHHQSRVDLPEANRRQLIQSGRFAGSDSGERIMHGVSNEGISFLPARQGEGRQDDLGGGALRGFLSGPKTQRREP